MIHCLEDLIREFREYLLHLQPKAVQNQDKDENNYPPDFISLEELEEFEIKQMYWILYPAKFPIKDLLKKIETIFKGYSEEQLAEILKKELHGFTPKEIQTVSEVLFKQIQKRKQMIRDTKELTAVKNTNVNPESVNILDRFLQKIEEEEKGVEEKDRKIEEKNISEIKEEEENFNMSIFHAFMKNAETIRKTMEATKESSHSEPQILISDLWKILVKDGRVNKELQDGRLDPEQWQILWQRMKNRIVEGSRTINYRDLFEIMIGKETVSKEEYEKLKKEKESFEEEVKALKSAPPKIIEVVKEIPILPEIKEEIKLPP
eukprot:TRINITY_DN1412_c0_g1_i6.p1 TRINITY_DN1412_c0_g1~~TRINITY_DN1412_c0_g1_i6.p1  ORF type:complete len:319 (+),score=69.23 TRINITY_DN1412_c0_g1_i6:879-1835(+)